MASRSKQKPIEAIIDSQSVQMGELFFKDYIEDFNENDEYFFISWIQNVKSDQYRHIGKALFEFAFRMSILFGNQGHIKNHSIWIILLLSLQQA